MKAGAVIVAGTSAAQFGAAGLLPTVEQAIELQVEAERAVRRNPGARGFRERAKTR
ncbi:MAG: hypothetical protein ABJA98_29345 [Acidobacteriota bacterium]